MSTALRVVHLASLARSGETLVLRALAAHPQVQVVHDLHATNTDTEQRLFQLLRVWPAPTLPRWQLERHLAPGWLAPTTEVLVLKQGVFAPRGRPAGFGLIRNPYAVFCSLWSYDAKLAGQTPTADLNRHYWQTRRLPRLRVWVDASLPALGPVLRAETDPVRQFLHYWEGRVAQILGQQDEVLHYEDFVGEPEAALRRIARALGLPFDAGMLQAHRRHPAGLRGHGGIDLSAPIRPAPAWARDPLVPLAPFAQAVRRGPVAAWRDLYEAPPAVAPRSAVPAL